MPEALCQKAPTGSLLLFTTASNFGCLPAVLLSMMHAAGLAGMRFNQYYHYVYDYSENIVML